MSNYRPASDGYPADGSPPDYSDGYPTTPPPTTPPPTTPPPTTPPPGAAPGESAPGTWAPQPGMPSVPPPGQDAQWQGADAPAPTSYPGDHNPSYPAFPTQPPPGAKPKVGFGRVLKIGVRVVGVLVVGLIAIGAIFGDSTNAAYIDEGECFAEFSQFESTTAAGEDQTVDQVDTADCDEAHALEAYYVADAYVSMAEIYPGQVAVDEAGLATCEQEFETFVGIEWEVSELDFWWLTPTADGWDRGDRELICLVGSYQRDLTVGTLENTRR